MNTTFWVALALQLALSAVVLLNAHARRPPRTLYGVASWYGDELRGSLMANGHPFDPDGFTAASWDFPLGTWVKVSFSNKSVVVQITDRGPAKRLVLEEGRIIDLSEAAFSCLAPTEWGLIAVSVVPVSKK